MQMNLQMLAIAAAMGAMQRKQCVEAKDDTIIVDEAHIVDKKPEFLSRQHRRAWEREQAKKVKKND